MPELPEVEVVRRGLERHVVGRRLATAAFVGARVARRYPDGPVALADSVRGRDVLSARRRGKYLWLVLSGSPDGQPSGLVIHLGMSGQLLVVPADRPWPRHLHASFDLAGTGPPGLQLRFVDQRTFGGMALSDLVEVSGGPAGSGRSGGTTEWLPRAVLHIARDPLDPAFDQDAVVRRMKLRHSAVKRALLDQGLVSGIGNIYADEALWRARVHGERPCDGLSRPMLGRILDAARTVMTEALAAGGTSFDTLYVNVNGASGYFDRSLAVYGQQGRGCPRCATVIRREGFMNRSSHWCPRCQPRPRHRPRRPPAGT